jgi:hypothetical protein
MNRKKNPAAVALGRLSAARPGAAKQLAAARAARLPKIPQSQHKPIREAWGKWRQWLAAARRATASQSPLPRRPAGAWSQKELASQYGVTQATISRICKAT